MRTEYKIGDPVVDLAQGRPMVVVNVPDQSVEEWSDTNDYDLAGNYANSRFDPRPDEPVVETVYVSDVRSEPSKTYTFPVSRIRLIEVHHADDGRRLADRVLFETLVNLGSTLVMKSDDETAALDTYEDTLQVVARGVADDVIERVQFRLGPMTPEQTGDDE